MYNTQTVVNACNEINIIDSVAIINLYNTKGQIIDTTVIDSKFVNYIKTRRWFKLNKYGYVSNHYLTPQGIKIMISLHRSIVYLNNNFILDDSTDVDHIDGNPLNNLIYNLRECNDSQNQMNKRKCKQTTSSKYKGVSFFKRDKKWKAEIYVNRKNLFLGLFVYEIDAAKAYNIAAIKYFGEFAQLNII